MPYFAIVLHSANSFMMETSYSWDNRMRQDKNIMERRDFLKTIGLASAGLALNTTSIATVLAQVPPNSFEPSNRDPISHIINRLTFGVTPDLYDHVKLIGIDAFIEEQLNPDSVDDSELDELLANFDVTWMTTSEILDKYRGMGLGPVLRQLVYVYILRALYSHRQLYERFNVLWSDHFHIFLGKNPVGFFKPEDERDVIRAHALDTFPNMLKASAHSPAMLIYLDNAQSDLSHPNENYARELLELHTLGVDGGYTEEDVKAVARAFTGWSILRPQQVDVDRGDPGAFMFRRFIHDNEEKIILGQTLPANNGKADGDAVLEMLAQHESTAHFISTKLARRFISDFPPESIVNSLAQTYLQTSGDIKAMMRVLLNSDEFWNAPPKFKRPFEYTMSLLRSVDYQRGRERGFVQLMRDALDMMGHMPHLWPAPNGYPDVGAYWMNNLLPRWNMAIASVTDSNVGEPNLGRLEQMLEQAGVLGDTQATLQYFANYLIGRDLDDSEATIVLDFLESYPVEARMQAGLGFMMATPAFQYK